MFLGTLSCASSTIFGVRETVNRPIHRLTEPLLWTFLCKLYGENLRWNSLWGCYMHRPYRSLLQYACVLLHGWQYFVLVAWASASGSCWNRMPQSHDEWFELHLRLTHACHVVHSLLPAVNHLIIFQFWKRKLVSHFLINYRLVTHMYGEALALVSPLFMFFKHLAGHFVLNLIFVPRLEKFINTKRILWSKTGRCVFQRISTQCVNMMLLCWLTCSHVDGRLWIL